MEIITGNPFSLWVGDPATDETREVWAWPGDDGGCAQYYPRRKPSWATGGRLVFTSPVLFVKGDDDRNVLFIQTTELSHE